MLSRRRLLTAGALTAGSALLLPGLANAAPSTSTTSDFSTREGWLAWLATHRDQVGVFADNGARACLSHRAQESQPLASAVKPVHLAAYTLSGLAPDTKVTVGEWERFYLPHTDGGAHEHSQRLLGIEADPATKLAKNPAQQVTLDQIAGTMIYFSDNAATDYLRHRLGAAALRRAALRGGWSGVDTRSKLADFLYLLLPEEVRPGVPRREMGDRLEQRFLTEPAFRDRARARVVTGPHPSWEAQVAWARDSGGASAATLAAFHRTAATGRFPEATRRHLEHTRSGSLPPGVAGIGWKGGSLAGVLVLAGYTRWNDGRVGSAALLLQELSLADWTAMNAEGSLLFPVFEDLMLDPAWQGRVARALRG
ncbi:MULTISPECIES: serine hydrolase [unclassified Crossiella]|uniref:serine hydrolase n=1 Tax=unclassified Crossiella TaxID=2620835 RepID=UPI001FFF65A8|nr:MULTISPECIES: serine hydrolase [unclassified Crossiella]MCK2245375.1 serine hydrolase [Crossiella sp. S99.2]MCK2259038.1 serine hydrolase [Crossiella sp. S99.1]